MVSLASPGSTFYLTKPLALLAGTLATANVPYLSLTGTSMAAPVVAGTVALMLQANPALTPNAVKAILQYTAQQYPGYDALTQGAGFLNAVGAVRLARLLRRPRAWRSGSGPEDVEQAHRLGQPSPWLGIPQSERQRLQGRHHVGCAEDRRWRQHRVGHRVRQR